MSLFRKEEWIVYLHFLLSLLSLERQRQRFARGFTDVGGENVHEPNVQILIKGNSPRVALKKEQSTFEESSSLVFLYSHPLCHA